jgi:hypothetical protein
MNCDRYKNALLDAAASHEEPGDKLAHHLEVCAQCRAAFRTEQELLSRIDDAIRTRVNEDPRPGFLAQIRSQLSRVPHAQPESNPVWAVAAAALALVLVVVYPMINLRQPGLQGNSKVATIRGVQDTAPPQFGRTSNRNSAVRPRQLSGKRTAVKGAAAQEPEVLVPPDEQRAFAQFVARVQGRDAMAEAVVRPAPAKAAARSNEMPEVHSVDIAGLQLDRERDEWMDQAGGSE